jgi:hypothetical protein
VMDLVSFAYAVHRTQIINGSPWFETQPTRHSSTG